MTASTEPGYFATAAFAAFVAAVPLTGVPKPGGAWPPPGTWPEGGSCPPDCVCPVDGSCPADGACAAEAAVVGVPDCCAERALPAA